MAKPDDDYGADPVIVGFNPEPTAEPEAVEQARLFLRAIRETCRPLDQNDLIVELGKLRMKVARRSEEQTDTVLLLEAYAEEMKDYPADLVVEVLRKWPAMSRFWPAAEELKNMMDWRLRQRTGLLRALEEIARREGSRVA